MLIQQYTSHGKLVDVRRQPWRSVLTFCLETKSLLFFTPYTILAGLHASESFLVSIYSSPLGVPQMFMLFDHQALTWTLRTWTPVLTLVCQVLLLIEPSKWGVFKWLNCFSLILNFYSILLTQTSPLYTWIIRKRSVTWLPVPSSYSSTLKSPRNTFCVLLPIPKILISSPMSFTVSI